MSIFVEANQSTRTRSRLWNKFRDTVRFCRQIVGNQLRLLGHALRRFLQWFNKTWLGELLNIYIWKESWMAFSLPVLIFVVPACYIILMLNVLFAIPPGLPRDILGFLTILSPILSLRIFVAIYNPQGRAG